MKNLKSRLGFVSLVSLILLACTAAYGQITPIGDSYTNTADATTNYGAKTLLDVDGATQTTYIQFNLVSIPAGANISQATLKLYVNTVVTAGSFNVDYVNGAWSESTIDASNAPALGAAIASNVALTTADKNQYILINITAAVQAWLNGSEANDGIALVANSTFNATFDSKESTTTSHSAELDIVFAGDGTLTGVTTASGSGLTGGGTSGTLNLGLTTACAASQVLQWSGSAWSCAAVGTGTVTSVASGTGLTGGPITGSGTLSINTAVVPQLAAANTFTGNQTVNGNLSATGVVTGSGYQIGSNLFDYGSFTTQSAFLGFSGNTTMTGGANTSVGYQAFVNNTTGTLDTAIGKHALLNNSTGTGNTASGYQSLVSNTTGSYNIASGDNSLLSNTTGSYNSASGVAALDSNTTANYNTASGYEALFSNTTGTQNTAIGSQALYSNTTSNYNTASGTSALSNNTGSGSTAAGASALFNNTTGNYNTAQGVDAGDTTDGSPMTGSYNTFAGASSRASTGTLGNATAIGANAEVAESNALVLGSIAGVNTATASTNVGIGTTTPNAALDVVGNGIQILLGDPGCGSGLAGIGFVVAGGFDSCNNFAIVGKSTGDIYINSVESGTIHFRNNNSSDLMTIDTSGDVSIKGNLSKGGGSFKIDHPLDPANKYLYHSFVESPDMMNVYNGVATLDARGVVWITLPDYFEALNRDFRYQLTSMGRPQPSLYVSREVSGNRFKISGGKPGGKVSWQVTGIRHDAYADAHRIPVAVEKPPQEQGHYLHPELFGAAAGDVADAQAQVVIKSGP